MVIIASCSLLIREMEARSCHEIKGGVTNGVQCRQMTKQGQTMEKSHEEQPPHHPPRPKISRIIAVERLQDGFRMKRGRSRQSVGPRT
jgi:hypothetical protein